MKLRRPFVSLLLLCLSMTLASCRTIEGVVAHHDLGRVLRRPAQSPPARMEIRDGIPVIHVYGTPEEMGRQYGQVLRPALRAMHRFVNAFVPAPMRERLLRYGAEHETNLPPALRAELQAVAAAAEVPYVELVTLNIVPKMACSALAVWDPDNPTDPHLIMGRNAEYFSMGLSDRGMVVTVRHPEQGIPTVSINFIGMIGAFTGINARGVAFGNMLVFNAAGPERQEGGLPIQLALRMAAEQSSTAAEMTQQLCAQRHVIPMNVMVADASEALVAELGLDGVHIRRGHDGVLAATNHFRSPALHEFEESCPRHESLLSTGRLHRADMTVELMEEALHTARIRGLNIQAVVFEPARMKIHVSINRLPASAGPYVPLDLRELFAVPPLGGNSE